MQLRLYTLSPLHIGTGENLAPLDYVAYDGRFYPVRQDDLIRLVKQAVPNGARTFANWISDQYAELNETRDNRRQSAIMAATNPYTFFQQQGKAQVLLQYLRSVPGGGSKVILDDDRAIKGQPRPTGAVDLGQVREAARSTGHPYLPGSSLKGALRTALLYNYLSNHADVAQIERIVKKQLADPKVRRESFAKPLEEAVFFCDYFDGARNKTRSGEAQMDLMRVVSLSDAHWVASKDRQPEVAKINIYLVEKIRHPQRRDEVSFVSGRQRQATYAEVIPAGSELSAELHVDGRYLQHLSHWLGSNDGLKRGDDRYWIGAGSRLEKLFGISLEEARTLKPEAIEEKVGAYLLACYDRFSRRQLERQGIWLDHYLRHDSGDANSFAARIQNGFAPVVGAAQPLLHLGYGAGFTATTVLLYFLEDRSQDNLVKAILEKFQIGKAPNQPPPYTANVARFPKSRRLVESENRIQPLGWIALLKGGEAPPDVDVIAPAAFASGNPASEPAKPIEPEYFKGTLNPKKPPMLDAVVVKSGRPNRVLVYLEPERRVEMELSGYASPIEENTVIIVRSIFNNKGELLQVSFSKRKS